MNYPQQKIHKKFTKNSHQRSTIGAMVKIKESPECYREVLEYLKEHKIIRSSDPGARLIRDSIEDPWPYQSYWYVIRTLKRAGILKEKYIDRKQHVKLKKKYLDTNIEDIEFKPDDGWEKLSSGEYGPKSTHGKKAAKKAVKKSVGVELYAPETLDLMSLQERSEYMQGLTMEELWAGCYKGNVINVYYGEYIKRTHDAAKPEGAAAASR